MLCARNREEAPGVLKKHHYTLIEHPDGSGNLTFCEQLFPLLPPPSWLALLDSLFC